MEPQDNWDEKLEELEDRLLDAMDDPPSFLQKLKKIPLSAKPKKKHGKPMRQKLLRV